MYKVAKSQDEHKTPVYATLVLRGKDLVPQEVSDVTGIRPTKSFKRGDIRKGTRKWPHGYWELTSKESVQTSDLSMHLNWLMEQLEPIQSQITGIINQEGIDAEITCLWVFPTSHENLSLNPEQIRGIASLGLKLIIDIYCSE